MSETPSELVVLGTRWAESRYHIERSPSIRKTPIEPPRFLDWTIDGVPLRDRLTFPNGRPCTDVTLLTKGSEGERFAIESLRALVLENESGFDPWVQFSDGRAGLLFCEVCGDVDCGAVSADVRVNESQVEWRDVAYQDGTTEAIGIEEVAPFTLRFERTAYERTVRDLLARWTASVNAV